MANAFAAFPGLAAIDLAEMPISRGITPSVGIVRVPARNDMNLRAGTLTIAAGGSVAFPDCLPVSYNLRRVKSDREWFIDIPVLDHRWRWANGEISGEYNVRKSDGTLDERKKREPAQLATLCLQKMGEVGFNVSRMPTGMYPPANWDNTNPALALANLCEQIACTICGGEFARVNIWPLGVGNALPSGAIAHPLGRFGMSARPTRIVFVGGDTIFQSKLALEAVARNLSGGVIELDSVSYAPANGWGGELPWTLSGVTNIAARAAAMESVRKWYRVASQADGSMAVPGSSVPVTSPFQYLLNDHMIDSADEVDGSSHALAAEMAGTYWPYGDDMVNVSTVTKIIGPWKLDTKRSLVIFPFPVFKYSSDNSVSSPARTYEDPTLYLMTGYRLRQADGDVVGFRRTRELAGPAGEFVIRRPEVFVAVRANYASIGGTRPTGTRSTIGNAVAEADRYLAAFARKFSSDAIFEQEYAGISPLPTDGLIAQVKYTAGLRHFPAVRASTAEFDLHSTPEKERRRREVLAWLKEQANL